MKKEKKKFIKLLVILLAAIPFITSLIWIYQGKFELMELLILLGTLIIGVIIALIVTQKK